MKINGPAVFILLSLQSVFSQHIIHIYHPWSTDPQRSAQPVHIISPAMGPAFPGSPMVAEARSPWYTYSWSDAEFKPNSEFYFVSYIPTAFNATANAANYFNGPNAFNTTSSFPPGGKEVWIVPNGSASATLLGFPPSSWNSKVALIFNPWPQYAPMAKVNADTAYTLLPMSSDPKRCGWYRVVFPDSARTVRFKPTLGTEAYGQAGMGSSQAIDLTSAFATADTLFLLPEPYPHGAPKVVTAFPIGVSSLCGMPVAVTIRDFSKNHPDFEFSPVTDVVRKGMVANTLGPDRKPVLGPSPASNQSLFDTWFRTDSTHADSARRNYETCLDLPLSKTAKGGWGYDSDSEPSHAFFPIDDFNRFGETSESMYMDRQGAYHKDPTGKLHNFHFCLEMHAEFTYEVGQSLNFSGDDDAWIFIDNKLALDLGGTHSLAEGEIKFAQLGLIAGKRYPFDFFLCERQTQGSNLTLETSAFLVQSAQLIAMRMKLPDGAVRYSIYENLPSKGQCSPPAGSGDTLPAPSKFTLEGPSVPSGVVLAVGASYGGITLAANQAQLTLDTSKIVGLAPGLYVITYTSEKTGRSGKFLFTVAGTVSVGRPAGLGSPMLQVYTADSRHLQVRFRPGGARDGKGFAEVKVMSMQGTAVYRKVIPGAWAFTESIDGVGFKSGVYLVIVKSGNRRYSRRIVIR